MFAARSCDTPIGTLLLVSCQDGLCLCDYAASRRYSKHLSDLVKAFGGGFSENGGPVLDRAAEELEEYFCGERTAFDLPLRPVGTPFQQEVWAALTEIEYGRTLSYSALAARIGQPGAARAVASACASNPISLFIPCHRIVGVNGGPVGYAGGVPAKAWLLRLEAAGRRSAETTGGLSDDALFNHQAEHPVA